MARNTHYAAPAVDDALVETIPRHLTKAEFGRRLYRLMLAKGWTQSELARRADIGRDAVSTYVRGRSFPEPTSAQKLADALGVNIEELYPNVMETAVEEAHPALEIRQTLADPTRVWMRLNRSVSTMTAAKIIDLISQEDKSRNGQ